MFKFLILIFIFFFVIVRIGGFVIKLLFSGFGGQQRNTFDRDEKQQQKKPRDGNVSIDYVPDSKKKDSQKFKGGDYVDYEEME